MKIEGLRNILMKKAHGDSMRSFLYHMADTHLVRYVNESLEKMAKGKSPKAANALLQSFGKSLPASPKMTQMIYDYLSHHGTRYKSALKSKNQGLAAKHITKFIKGLHLIDKLTNDGNNNHTEPSPEQVAINPNLKTALLDFKAAKDGKKIGTSWVDTKPWERNAYLDKKSGGHPSPYHTDHYTTHTKGVARDHANHMYLQQAPHFSYHDDKEVVAGNHNKAWPLEQTMVNGRYVHIDDNHQSTGEYEPHTLDEHPILSDEYRKLHGGKNYLMFDVPSKGLTPQDQQKYDQGVSEWRQKYLLDPTKYTSLIKKDPNIGSQPSAPVHADVEPLDLEYHKNASQSSSPSTSASSSSLASNDSSMNDVRAEIARIRGGSAPAAAPAAAPTAAPAATPATNKKLSMGDVQAEIDRIRKLKG